MDSNYALTILWFFFACITFGCIVGGDEPKVWKQPSKSYMFKAWLLSVFWPITYVVWFFSNIKPVWLIGWRK